MLSRNEHNVEGEVEPKPVEETFERHGETLSLHVAGQIIRTTNEHPFYVRDQGWTAARELRAGDVLATDNGRWKEVEKTVPTGESETVFNFRVADHHTYFVGSKSWGFAVWGFRHLPVCRWIYWRCRRRDSKYDSLWPTKGRY